MLHSLMEKLYTSNEYGVEYLDYWREPPPELVAFAKETYNIRTDCHNICLNCQLRQIEKYGEGGHWAVRVKKLSVYKDKRLKESVGALRKLQGIVLLKREGPLAQIRAQVHYGSCINDPSHPVVYRENKSFLSEAKCETCGGGLVVNTKRIEGWVPFKAITAFRIKCDFIPKEYTVPAQIRASLSDEELDQTLTLLDPVKWAKDVLGVQLRGHQKIDVMCTAKHTVRRWGRRCLVGDTPILLADGTWKSVKDIRPGDQVISRTEDGKLAGSRVTAVYDNGVQPTFEVKLHGGLSLRLTSNHPLLSRRYYGRDLGLPGWHTVEGGLAVGDRVCTIDGYSHQGGVNDADDGFRWFRIKSIKQLAPERTYDITVPGTHNFVANGIVCHNTGKSFSECFQVLRFCLTERFQRGVNADGKPIEEGATVLIVSPFTSQLDELFGEIRKLTERNPDIEITRNVKTPFFAMHFSNGAKVLGFPTGVQTGNEADTLRGRGADLILVDEADAMDEASIVRSLQPIQITFPNVRVMASSTPRGKQEWFWRCCTQSPHYRETFFPATVLDHWDDVKEEIEGEGTTGDIFKQEYMALFTTQTSGVYQVPYIAEAEVHYEYGQAALFPFGGREINLASPVPKWIYSIGVDWNTNAGVEIVVTGLQPEEIRWWVVEVLNIPKQGYQQYVAMQHLVDLNEKWDPRFIYIDAGYGQTQFEALLAFSEQMKTRKPGSAAAKMGDRLKKYDFSSKVSYRNPATGQEEKKPAKPFLVENSVRQFEQGRVKFSYNDHLLHRQLLGYIVEGIGIHGLPKYGMSDKKAGDHRLDALNLALIAYMLEMSDYSLSMGMVSKIGFAGLLSAGQGPHLTLPEESWAKFKSQLPEGIGTPGRLIVQYDPGYIAEQEAKRSSTGKSRTADLDRVGRQGENVLRIGFENDTEWKYPAARVMSQRSSRRPPRRKNI